MDEFLIATIVESYRERSLLPKFGDGEIARTLTSDLEGVLASVVLPKSFPDGASPEPEPPPQQDGIDIRFSETHYHIGPPNSGFSGRNSSKQGHLLKYLLEHLGEAITLRDATRIGTWANITSASTSLQTIATQLLLYSTQFRLNKTRRVHNTEYTLERIQG